MTIRQSVAAFYALTALVFLVLQTMPVMGSAMTTLTEAVGLSAGTEPGLTGHPEVDELPAYLTDEDGHARF